MTNPLVSIIVPMYNAEKYIAETLDSVLAQSYSNWECIIVDDGSTDSSKNIVSKYCDGDMRIKYFYQENAGASSARNNGVSRIEGEYIQYLDADDVILQDKIKNMIEKSVILDSNVVLYSNMILGDDANIYDRLPLRFKLNLGQDITFDETYRKYAIDFGITPTCLLFPKEAILDAKWDTNLGPGEDWDYFLQILDNGYTFRYLPEIYVLYRNSTGSHSKNEINSFKSHYKVAVNWVIKKNKNHYFFSKRCARIYKRNLFLYFFKKVDKVIHPQYRFNDVSIKLFFFIILIYPLVVYYLFRKVIVAIKKKLKRKVNEV